LLRDLGTLFAAFTAVALPSTATAFSAQDVLTYCQSTHADPTFVRDKLRSSGWADIDPAATKAVAETLALTQLATRNFTTRDSYSPSDWVGDWAVAQENADRYLTSLDEDQIALLIEPKTSSLILIAWTDGPAIRISCTLAVTDAATKSQSYHPRLQRPDAGDAFYSILESSDRSTTRVLGGSASVAISPAIVKTELGITTDVVAVFDTWTTYPASAVRP
jgi:hypothetical protein